MGGEKGRDVVTDSRLEGVEMEVWVTRFVGGYLAVAAMMAPTELGLGSSIDCCQL